MFCPAYQLDHQLHHERSGLRREAYWNAFNAFHGANKIKKGRPFHTPFNAVPDVLEPNLLVTHPSPKT